MRFGAATERPEGEGALVQEHDAAGIELQRTEFELG
jgi:hypothetical protein